MVGLAVGVLLLVSAGRSLWPAKSVRVEPVVFGATSQPDDNEGGARAPGRSVQAPGWLEADPFYVACTSLADGVVDEMLVLEGDYVEEGQVVARLVDDDASLALARAEADLAVGRARLDVAGAELAAAETDWEHPVERERAVGICVRRSRRPRRSLRSFRR